MRCFSLYEGAGESAFPGDAPGGLDRPDALLHSALTGLARVLEYSRATRVSSGFSECRLAHFGARRSAEPGYVSI